MTRISHMTNQQLADELGYIKAEKADIARRATQDDDDAPV